jgi:hypothetical protein
MSAGWRKEIPRLRFAPACAAARQAGGMTGSSFRLLRNLILSPAREDARGERLSMPLLSSSRSRIQSRSRIGFRSRIGYDAVSFPFSSPRGIPRGYVLLPPRGIPRGYAGSSFRLLQNLILSPAREDLPAGRPALVIHNQLPSRGLKFTWRASVLASR